MSYLLWDINNKKKIFLLGDVFGLKTRGSVG